MTVIKKYFANSQSEYSTIFEYLTTNLGFIFFKEKCVKGNEHYVMQTLRFAEVKAITEADFKLWDQQESFNFFDDLEQYKLDRTQPIWK